MRLSDVLSHLTGKGPNGTPRKAGDGYLAFCPAHANTDTPSLSVTEKNGKVLLHCFGADCSYQSIMDALHARGLPREEPGNGRQERKRQAPPNRGLTLAELAAVKRLPVEFLRDLGVSDCIHRGRPAVRIAYRGTDGATLATRYRVSLAGKPRFLWESGSHVLPYGLERLDGARAAGWVLLVEGESDCWALWQAGLPALGIPGKGTWQAEWAEHLAGIPEVFLWQEPGADDMTARVLPSIPGLRVIPAPEDTKDPSDAHARGDDLAEWLLPRRQKARPAAELLPDGAGGEEPAHPYRAEEGGLVWLKPSGDGKAPIRLTNFTARLVGDVIKDDGVNPAARFFEVEARRNGAPVRFAIPAASFPGLAWVSERLGANAIVYPGMAVRDHARAAIQMLSEQLPERRVFTHTGWRELAGGWAYLHAGGAIGACGMVPNAEVELEADMRRYCLPDPPADARPAVAASLRFLDIAARERTWPLLAAVYLAPLAELVRCDFAVWMHGPTQSCKSTTAALLLSHYGTFDRNALPANLTSSANALELQAFAAKDALFVVDDYAPAPDAKSAAAQDSAVNRLLRSVGDSHGRNRATATGGLVGERPPRCLPFVTAELPPPGAQSSAARSFEVAWQRAGLNLALLARAGEEDAPRYPEAMAAYVRWLAGRFAELRPELRERIKRTRDAFGVRGVEYGRIAENAAKLAVGAGVFLEFATDTGAMDTATAAALRDEAEGAILTQAIRGSAAQVERKPSTLFLEYLRAMFAQGTAHLVERATGGTPANAAAFGYSVRTDVSAFDGEPELSFSLPGSSVRIGWVDSAEGTVYLDAKAAHQAVTRYARDAGERFPVTARALGEHLERDGLLVLCDKDRREKSFRFGGAILRGLCLDMRALCVEEGEGDQGDRDAVGAAGREVFTL